MPNTLTDAVAHDPAIEILGLIKAFGIAGGVEHPPRHQTRIRHQHDRRNFVQIHVSRTQYFVTGNLDSVEVAILPLDNDSNAFSRGGDPGALIVDARRRFVALLTSGTNKGAEPSDITLTTPMEWVWELVKDKFPGADLYFDGLEAFLTHVV